MQFLHNIGMTIHNLFQNDELLILMRKLTNFSISPHLYSIIYHFIDHLNSIFNLLEQYDHQLVVDFQKNHYLYFDLSKLSQEGILLLLNFFISYFFISKNLIVLLLHRARFLHSSLQIILLNLYRDQHILLGIY